MTKTQEKESKSSGNIKGNTIIFSPAVHTHTHHCFYRIKIRSSSHIKIETSNHIKR